MSGNRFLPSAADMRAHNIAWAQAGLVRAAVAEVLPQPKLRALALLGVSIKALAIAMPQKGRVA